MKNKTKSLFQGADKMTLTDKEKEGVKYIINAYIDTHPVRVGLLERIREQRSARKSKLRIMPLALALLLTFSGGTALAASGSLPGDLLYPVKVGINEQLRGAIAFTSEAQANYQGDLAARRIAEMEQLAAEGKLGADIKEKAEARFEKHSEKTLDLIEKLEAKGNFKAAAAVSSRFEASLEAHEELIAEMSERGESIRTRLADIQTRINSRLNAAAQARIDAEAQITAEGEQAKSELRASIETRARQSEREISSAESELRKYEAGLSSRVKAEVEARIKAAEDAHANGVAQMEVNNPTAALKYFQNSVNLTYQSEVMMRSWISFALKLEERNRFQGGDGDDVSNDNVDEVEQEEESSQEESNIETETNMGGSIDVDTGGLDAGVNGRLDGQIRIGS
ncbi:MAG: DUF5667 domain-containing protein [Candidatus Colwellbacteria bacterium]|nr:DUF5667 domain-containing protein [Candidatus Colwellbacteria bacterium]